MLAIDPGTFIVIFGIFFKDTVETLNAIPTKIEVGNRAIVVTMDRAKQDNMDDSFRRICIPMDAIADVKYGSNHEGLQGVFTRIFDESGGIVIKPRRFFIVTETKKTIVVEKKVAADQEKGAEFIVGKFRYFLLPPGEQRTAFFKKVTDAVAALNKAGGDDIEN